MERAAILLALSDYKESPFITPHEETILVKMLTFIASTADCFSRTTTGHVTGSAWILSDDGTQALLTHHKKLGMWLQLGGHADGNPDIAAVALQEAHEESGIAELSFITSEIFDIDIHPIPGPCKAHYDIRYLFKAPHGAEYVVSEESHDLAWVPLEEILRYTTEQSVTRMADKSKRMPKPL